MQPNLRSGPPIYTIALLSSAVLGYEILLMRLFSITQWHNFAYMIISLALLGYGISGSFLLLTQRWLLQRFHHSLRANLFLFAISTIGSYLLIQQIPFNPQEVLWDISQQGYLLLIYLLLMLPFFFAANAIALTLIHYRGKMSLVYGYDLLGAGIGSLAIIGLLFLVFPMTALIIIATVGLFCLVLSAWELGLPGRQLFISLLITALLPVVSNISSLQLQVSPYKGLSQALRIDGAEVIQQRSSPLGLLSVLQNNKIPLRHAPGLSLNASMEPPPQLGLFTDADALTTITQFSPRRNASLEQLGYLDMTTSALPYHLTKLQQVLILGAGGGSDVLQALYHQVNKIDAVELNPQLIDLVNTSYRKFSGNLYNRNNVQIHIDEVRNYVSHTEKYYDLIQLALLDSFNASSAGLYALNENYLYTREALQLYLGRLSPGGYLAITRWIKIPPRDTLKIFATAVAAMRDAGITEIAKRLLLIRGWQTSTLLIKNGEVTEEEITAIKYFSEQRSFDTVYYPGITADSANRNNILIEPYFYQGAQSLLSDGREQYLQDYKFNLRPATDDRPYFFNFFKWKSFGEILSLRGRGGMALLESGYLVLLVTLLQAILASVLLVLLPYWYYRRHQDKPSEVSSSGRVFGYFFMIGLGFLFIEIAFIQKFILFLHHPLYAVAVVLSAFLIFAGIGSRWSCRHENNDQHRRGSLLAIGGIIVIGLLYIVVLDPVFSWLHPAGDTGRILIAIILIAPLAFFMGMPFPLALSSLSKQQSSLVPWAWGVNGFASVLSAVLATLLAIHAGFSMVILIALLFYMIAGLLFPRRASA